MIRDGFGGAERKNNGGFTLVELAVVVAIIGVLAGTFYKSVLPMFEYSKRASTEQRLEIIARHLTMYVHQNNRLPCPAIPDNTPTGVEPPFGFQRGSGADGSDNDAICTGWNNVHGIVPFRTLGMKENEVKDAWGNYITYYVSPAFALATDTFTGVNAYYYNQIHPACRSRDWMIKRGDAATVNKNPGKARFCCPPIGPVNGIIYPDGAQRKDIRIRDAVGGGGPDLWPVIRSTETLIYKNVNVLAEPHELDTADAKLTDAIAYVIVSHGKNGAGAYTGVNGGIKIAVNEPAGTAEQENYRHNNNSLFISMPVNSQRGNNYFDDILLWRTQSQIYSENGDATCLKP